jgi:hypothetical protein
MVYFAVCFVFFFRKAKSSIMIGFAYRNLPVTVGIGGCSSVPPNLGPGFVRAATPSICVRKSRCHQSRRNSPSVMLSRPIASWRRIASRIALSCSLRSFLACARYAGTQEAADLVGSERRLHP